MFRDRSLSAASQDHLWFDHILPRQLAHEGALVLHAGGVVVEGRAVAVTADTGGGKSTLTASLHATGHPILGDDALIVEDMPPRVRAVYPSLRLNPDSAETFFPGVEGRPMADWSPKRHLPLGPVADAAPLAALFVLGEAGAVTCRRLSPAEAVMAIIANSFAQDPGDRPRAQARMAGAVALAGAVPVWELCYPRDYAALPEVHATIRRLIEAA
ncbi:MAG: hypothetical protein H3C51_12275 [Rubellimicrobium sp.]|nr:hypothetical protein [Rubellimicrobium sp.]